MEGGDTVSATVQEHSDGVIKNLPGHGDPQSTRGKLVEKGIVELSEETKYCMPKVLTEKVDGGEVGSQEVAERKMEFDKKDVTVVDTTEEAQEECMSKALTEEVGENAVGSGEDLPVPSSLTEPMMKVEDADVGVAGDGKPILVDSDESNVGSTGSADIHETEGNSKDVKEKESKGGGIALREVIREETAEEAVSCCKDPYTYPVVSGSEDVGAEDAAKNSTSKMCAEVSLSTGPVGIVATGPPEETNSAPPVSEGVQEGGAVDIEPQAIAKDNSQDEEINGGDVMDRQAPPTEETKGDVTEEQDVSEAPASVDLAGDVSSVAEKLAPVEAGLILSSREEKAAEATEENAEGGTEEAVEETAVEEAESAAYKEEKPAEAVDETVQGGNDDKASVKNELGGEEVAESGAAVSEAIPGEPVTQAEASLVTGKLHDVPIDKLIEKSVCLSVPDVAEKNEEAGEVINVAPKTEEAGEDTDVCQERKAGGVTIAASDGVEAVISTQGVESAVTELHVGNPSVGLSTSIERDESSTATSVPVSSVEQVEEAPATTLSMNSNDRAEHVREEAVVKEEVAMAVAACSPPTLKVEVSSAEAGSETGGSAAASSKSLWTRGLKMDSDAAGVELPKVNVAGSESEVAEDVRRVGAEEAGSSSVVPRNATVETTSTPRVGDIVNLIEKKHEETKAQIMPVGKRGKSEDGKVGQKKPSKSSSQAESEVLSSSEGTVSDDRSPNLPSGHEATSALSSSAKDEGKIDRGVAGLVGLEDEAHSSVTQTPKSTPVDTTVVDRDVDGAQLGEEGVGESHGEAQPASFVHPAPENVAVSAGVTSAPADGAPASDIPTATCPDVLKSLEDNAPKTAAWAATEVAAPETTPVAAAEAPAEERTGTLSKSPNKDESTEKVDSVSPSKRKKLGRLNLHLPHLPHLLPFMKGHSRQKSQQLQSSTDVKPEDPKPEDPSVKTSAPTAHARRSLSLPSMRFFSFPEGTRGHKRANSACSPVEGEQSCKKPANQRSFTKFFYHRRSRSQSEAPTPRSGLFSGLKNHAMSAFAKLRQRSRSRDGSSVSDLDGPKDVSKQLQDSRSLEPTVETNETTPDTGNKKELSEAAATSPMQKGSSNGKVLADMSRDAAMAGLRVLLAEEALKPKSEAVGSAAAVESGCAS